MNPKHTSFPRARQPSRRYQLDRCELTPPAPPRHGEALAQDGIAGIVEAGCSETREISYQPSRETTFKRSENVDQVLAGYGIFLLRVAIGVDWIAHAFLKTYRGMNTH